MRRVAIGTRCRYGQSAFQQTFSVNALLVMINDLMFSTGVAGSGFLSFLMALGTKCRNIRRENRRFGIAAAFDTVRSVAFFAGWSVRIIFRDEFAVRAHCVFGGDFRMAR